MMDGVLEVKKEDFLKTVGQNSQILVKVKILVSPFGSESIAYSDFIVASVK